MIRVRVLVWSAAILAACALVATAPTRAGTGRRAGAAAQRIAACSSKFFEGDPRLGPATLPDVGGLGAMVAHYRRFGAMSESAFLVKYWKNNAWVYPSHDGFLHNRHSIGMLHVGEKVDRFGPPTSGFLAPAGTSYGARAIPPKNLDVYSGDPVCDYYLYRVLKPFKVEQGPIAPWFGQPGRGEQFLLMQRFLPGSPATPPVSWLLDHHYVAAVKLTAF